MITKTIVEFEQEEIDKIDEVHDILVEIYNELETNLIGKSSNKENEEVAYIDDTLKRLERIVYLYCNNEYREKNY